MTDAKRILIRNANIVTETAVLKGASLVVQGGRIEYVGDAPADSSTYDSIVDAQGGSLLPGFIDVHVHGGFGGDFMDAATEAYDAITRFHAQHGTTGMLATTVTASREAIERVLSAADSYRAGRPIGARLLGVHLEGPFISAKWPGAQNPAFIVPPQRDWLNDWTARYPGLIRMLTLAPESDGALELIAQATRAGIVAAAGHTDSSYAQILAAVEHGLRHAVHTFNAMKGLHHREPGTVGAVLTTDAISAEIIADGHHVHRAAIDLLTRVKTSANLLLITDAISAAGLGDGLYNLGGLDVIVKDGVATLKEGNSLAGSTLTMDRAVRFMVREVGLDLVAASKLASGNPAKLLAIDDRTGSIAVGKQADLVLLNDRFEAVNVWIEGNSLHE